MMIVHAKKPPKLIGFGGFFIDVNQLLIGVLLSIGTLF